MTTEQTLKNLVESCQLDPKRHFQDIYNTLIDKVYSYIRTRTSNQEDALDLTQEVFIDLYQSLSKFIYKSDGEFYSFIYTISKRKLAKYYGKRKEEVYPLEEILDSIAEENSTKDPDLNSALEKLDPETREIIILHHWSRYTFKEIADMLSLTESAARVRHHRALDTLLNSLTKT
jgi:RNA polymerase sigma-70 factor (ECF subfamily)